MLTSLIRRARRGIAPIGVVASLIALPAVAWAVDDSAPPATPAAPSASATTQPDSGTQSAPTISDVTVSAPVTVPAVASRADVLAMLPNTTQAVFGGDASWWWSATDSLRAQPDVAKQIAEVEQRTGLSFSSDVQPWIGQVSVAVLSANVLSPQAVIVAQVRDSAAFLRFALTVKNVLANKPGMAKWGQGSYHGTPLYTTTITADKGVNLPVEVAVLPSWVVVGIGPGATEKILDVSAKSIPSLAENARWQHAWSHLPPQAVNWFGVDLNKLMATSGIGQMLTAGAPNAETVKSLQQFIVGSMADTGEGFRTDVVYIPQTEGTRNMYRRLSKLSRPITGSSLTHLPSQSNIVAACGNMAGLYGYVKQQLIESAAPGARRRDILKAFAMFKPLEPLIAQFTGETGFSVTWQQGIGATMVAGASNPAAVTKTARGLATLTRKMHGVTSRDGDTYRLIVKGGDQIPFLTPTWAANGSWLAFSSSADLLSAPKGVTSLKLPAESAGASSVAMGNFKGLLPMIQMFSGGGADPEMKPVIDAIRGLELDPVEWAGWMTYHPDGPWAQETFTIKNWDWRKAITNEVDVISHLPSMKEQPTGKKGAAGASGAESAL